VGIVDISFQSVGTSKYTMPARRLNFHFTHLAVSYELNPTVHSSSLLIQLFPENELLSRCYAANSKVAGTCFLTHACDSTLKIARNTWQIVLLMFA